MVGQDSRVGQGERVGQGKVQGAGKGFNQFVESKEVYAENLVKIRQEFMEISWVEKCDGQTDTQTHRHTDGHKRNLYKDQNFWALWALQSSSCRELEISA